MVIVGLVVVSDGYDKVVAAVVSVSFIGDIFVLVVKLGIVFSFLIACAVVIN